MVILNGWKEIGYSSIVYIAAISAIDPSLYEAAKLDGASKLLMDIFGEENGVGARSAIGTNELPGGITVEIEFIFEI